MTELNRVTVSPGAVGGDAADYAAGYLPPDTNAVAFLAAGAFVTNGLYDEGAAEVVFGDADAGTVGGSTSYSHGFGMGGDQHVAANSAHVYYLGTQDSANGSLVSSGQGTYPTAPGPAGQFYRWTGLTRLSRADGTLAAGFTGATGYQFHFRKVNQDVIDGTGAVIGPDTRLTGVCASDTEVFLSDPANGRILVIDAATMADKRTLAVANAGALALAADGNVWAVVGAAVKKINKTTGGVIATVTPTHAPGKIGVCSDDGSLWVADDVTFQVKIYAADGSGSPTAYGTAGGIVGNAGVVTTGRLFGKVLGFDRAGTTYYVVDQPGGQGTRVRKFTGTTTLAREMTGLVFLGVPGWDGDATLYLPSHKLTVDADAQTWALAAVTIDLTNPAEFRQLLGISQCYAKSFGGRKYVFGMSQRGDSYTVHEKVSGTDILRPCGAFTANPGAALGADGRPGGLANWRPLTDGSAAPVQAEWHYVPSDWAAQPVGFMSLDDAGTIWFQLPKTGDPAFLWKVPLSSIDSHGNPVWDFAAAVIEGFPGGMTQGNLGVPARFFSDSANDRLLVAAGTPLRPPVGNPGLGTVLRMYGNWSTPMTRHVLWEQDLDVGRGQDQPYAMGVDFRTVGTVPGVAAVGYLNSSECHLFRLDSGGYVGRAVSSGVTGVNQTQIDSYFGVQPRVLASGKIAWTQERLVGNSCLLMLATPVAATTATVLDVAGWAARTAVRNFAWAQIGPTRGTLSWDQQYGGATVNVYSSPTSGGSYSLLQSGLTGASLLLTGLTRETDYYRKFSVTWRGIEGPLSAELYAPTKWPVMSHMAFTAADNTAATAYTPEMGPQFGATENGLAVFKILSNRLAQTNGGIGGSDYLRLTLPRPMRHWQVTLYVPSGGTFAGQHRFRYQDSNNCFDLRVLQGSGTFGGHPYLRLAKIAGGVTATVGSLHDLGAMSPGDPVAIDLYDDTDDAISAYVGGSQVIAPTVDHTFNQGWTIIWFGNLTDGTYAGVSWDNSTVGG